MLAFGVFGFLIGPVILSLVLSAIRIYRLDVLRVAVTGAPAAAPPAGRAIRNGLSRLGLLAGPRGV